MTPLPPSSGLRTVLAAAPDGLALHAAAWDRLAQSLPMVQPMVSHAWLSAWFEQRQAAGERSVVLFAYRGDRLVGVLPLDVAGSRRAVRLAVPNAYHTAAGDLALAPEDAHEALRALLRAALAAFPEAVRIQVGGVRDDSPTAAALGRRLPGWLVFREVDLVGSSIAIVGTYEDWLAGLSGSLKRDLKSADHKLAREGLTLSVQVLAGADARPEELDTLMALEASGWKGRGGSAIASRSQSVAKYRAVAARCFARGWLEWHILRLGDRVVAVRMLVRLDHGAMLLRSAYDEGLGKYHVGHLSLRALVQHEFARGQGGEVNLVTTWPWCARWAMRERPYERIRLVPVRPLALLRGALPEAARQLGRRIPAVRRLRDRWRGRPRTPPAGTTRDEASQEGRA